MGNWSVFFLPGCGINSGRDSSVRSYQSLSNHTDLVRFDSPWSNAF